MRDHHVLSDPIYKHYTGFPDILGRYAEFPEHREHRLKGQLPLGNLHLVLSGKGYVYENGTRTELKAGSGFYYGPGLEQDYGSDSEDPWDVFWVHISGDGVERLLDSRGRAAVWLFACRDVARVHRLAYGMLELTAPYDSSREVELAALLYELLAELAHHAERLGMPAGLDKRASMRAAAEYIRANCTQPLTLAAMAEHTGYSSYYFSRMFHEAVGRTPMQWLLESRIVVAKQLLVSTDWTVKQIAEAACFTQSSYFIARFREQTGLTPLQYRQLFGQSQA